MDEHEHETDLDRLWADLDGELSPDEEAALAADLAARPGLREQRARVLAVQHQLATLDRPGPAPALAAKVVARLAARETVALPARPWLWLAPVAQIALAVAALAWALPGLLGMLGDVDRLLWVPSATEALAGFESVWTVWMNALGGLSRGLVDAGLDPSASGLWLGVCVAGAVLAWLAGNSVLLASQSTRR